MLDLGRTAIPWTFELPIVFVVGLAAAVALLVLRARQLSGRGLPRGRVALLLVLRALAFLLLVALLARPVRSQEPPGSGRATVVVLLDRSRSMGLVEEAQTRHARAVRMARDLAPALVQRGYATRLVGFAEGAAPVAIDDAAALAPEGRLTDLGGAVAQSLSLSDPPPVAVVALTDGVANQNGANTAAVQGLLESGTAFLAVGYGRDAGLPTLSVQRLTGPSRVPPRQRFRLSAHLQALGAPLPAFDLLLLRDGRLVQSRRISADAVARSRIWTEGFDVVEPEPGLRRYAVQLRPSSAEVLTTNATSTAAVRVGEEKEFRILFVQGALTWDFKFIGRALRGDPAVKLTGLSRTSEQSVFRQNVESAEELASGFPTELAQLARYRVIVLSELKPTDLTPLQQDLVARFCAELGGGVLLLGGENTFDASWQGTRLEQLLPVVFDTDGGVRGVDRPFHLRLTDEAMRHAVFQVKDDGSSARVWEGLPTFSRYGRVLREKPGAFVWARHDQDSGPHGPRVLMAGQSYGGGLSAILCVQNVWRWRLARGSDVPTFDRFWRQLFRHLGQAGRQDFQIQLVDQELHPGVDVRAVVERPPRPDADASTHPEALEQTVRVRGPKGESLLEQKARIVPPRPLEVRFRAETEGLYTIAVEDAAGRTLATQPVEIRDVDREMERTGRDMENLRQWASLGEGFAVTAEEAGDAAGLADRVRAKLEARSARSRRVPAGINAVTLAVLMAGLCGEWALRRRWGLA
jgi:hypothetical protein